MSVLFLANISYAGNFGNPLDESLTIWGTANHDDVGIVKKLQDIGITIWWWEQIRDTIVYVAIKVVIPVFVFAGVIIAIIGFYKMMSSDSDEDQKKWFSFILWWVVGIVIMVSAGYLTNQLVGTEGTTDIIWSFSTKTSADPVYGAKLAEELYVKIFYPFLRVAMFVVLGILFMMAVVHAFKYIFRKDDEFQKKSFTILIYNALGIVVVILAKSMIEVIYGKYETVIDSNANNLWKIGDGVLEEANFLNLQTVLNWMLWLATFIVLILIIYQSYQLLTNPSDEELVTWLKKNIGYTFIGILIIGAGYLLVNFFIIT